MSDADGLGHDLPRDEPARDGAVRSEAARGGAAGPDVVDALLGLWRARVLLLVAAAVGVLLALVWVARAPVLYTAQLTLTPSEASPSDTASRLGSLASLAGISAGSHAGTPFDLFVLALTSRQVATAVARDETLLRPLFPERWDAAHGRWQVAARPAVSLRRLLGLPLRPGGRPTPGEVNDALDERVDVAQNTERGTATILFDDADPAFAVRFVGRIAAAADDLVKARTLARSRSYVAYLQDKLRGVTLAEDRQVLAAELGSRERSVMLASSPLPFAADPLGEPTSSTLPTSPRLPLSLAIGLGIGLAAGLLVLLLRHVRRRARRG